jgi:hypothetical protein
MSALPAQAALDLSYQPKRATGEMYISPYSPYWDGDLKREENVPAVSMRLWRYWRFDRPDLRLYPIAPVNWEKPAPLPQVEFGPWLRIYNCLYLAPWIENECEKY